MNKKPMRASRPILFAIGVLWATGPSLAAQASRITAAVSPEILLPTSDIDAFGVGGGSGLGARMALGRLPLAAGAGLGFAYQGGKLNDEAITMVSVGADFGPAIRLRPWLELGAAAEGGFYFAQDKSGASGRSLYFGANLRACASLSQKLELRLSGGWRDYYGLYQAATISLGLGLRLDAEAWAPNPSSSDGSILQPLVAGSSTTDKLCIAKAELDPIFPILFKYYDEHPVGKAVLHNGLQKAVEGVELSYFVNQYMDNPKVCATIGRIEPGADAEVDLAALFNDKLLGVSEGTKVSAKLALGYSVEGRAWRDETTQTVRVFDRNASMWDDDRKAAAFVTSKDQTVLRFAKNVLAMTKERDSRAINSKLLAAMAFHEATRLYGLSYVVDPTNSYAAVLNDKTVVDYLQFPRQTLDYKGGNCSALSILYCALLESVGIETAFITVPGHIFMAVNLDISPADARKGFASSDDLVIAGDKVWLPIETTARDSGFVKAWQAAAKEWRENYAKGAAALYPVHEAWALYEPVGFASDMGDIELPDKDKFAAVYGKELSGYIDGQIYAQVDTLTQAIAKSQRSPRSLNNLGVLYARYGLSEKAKALFEESAKTGYVPSIVNLGNLRFMAGDYVQALASYDQARKLAPDMPEILLAVARANHELENYGVVKVAYEQLKSMAPSLAERFSYLALRGAEGTRAADAASLSGLMIWSE